MTRYIRGRNHGTFGYIRVHSGPFYPFRSHWRRTKRWEIVIQSGSFGATTLPFYKTKGGGRVKGGLRKGGGVGGDSSPLEIYRASSPLEIYPGQLLSKLASSPLEIYPGQLLSKLPNCLSQTVRQSYLRLGCAKGSTKRFFVYAFPIRAFGPPAAAPSKGGCGPRPEGPNPTSAS